MGPLSRDSALERCTWEFGGGHHITSSKPSNLSLVLARAFEGLVYLLSIRLWREWVWGEL